MKRLTWSEKVDMIFTYPQISVKQIQMLLDIGQPTALELRDIAVKLAKEEGRWIGEKKVPTDLVLKAAGLDISYFVKMAEQEKNLLLAL